MQWISTKVDGVNADDMALKMTAIIQDKVENFLMETGMFDATTENSVSVTNWTNGTHRRLTHKYGAGYFAIGTHYSSNFRLRAIDFRGNIIDGIYMCIPNSTSNVLLSYETPHCLMFSVKNGNPDYSSNVNTNKLCIYKKNTDMVQIDLMTVSAYKASYFFPTLNYKHATINTNASGTLAPDEILLGQYFGNGNHIDVAYPFRSGISIPTYQAFEIAGLGSFIYNGFRLVRL